MKSPLPLYASLIVSSIAGLTLVASGATDSPSGPSGPVSAAPAGESTPGLTNADFEAGKPGETPPGWLVPKALAGLGFSAALTTNRPSQGRQCAEIRFPQEGTPPAGMFANLMQRIDATPWQGKRIQVTAAIRVEAQGPASRAQMWVRVDRAAGMGAFNNMNDRPVSRDPWADYSITLDVAADAQSVNVGLMAFDGATAWWDDVRLTAVSSFKTLTEPPRALTEAGLSNLVAFARLLGYVRHFHPSDQAQTNDWLRFAATALPQVESSDSAVILATRLEAAFRSAAPTVRVFATGAEEPSVPTELTAPAGNPALKVRVWEHVGYGQDGAGRSGGIYHSQRLSLEASGPASLPPYAQPTNLFRADLGAGVQAWIPTALLADQQGTLPHPPSAVVRSDDASRFAVGHRGARLATVMLTWNILQHFYPYWDAVDTDWAKELEIALRSAATDPDEAAFYRTLNRLTAALQDGHGTLTGPGMPLEAPLPVKVEWIENQIVVTRVLPEAKDVRPGDVIEQIDGVPATEAFASLASQVSAANPQRRKQVAFRFGWGPVTNSVTFEVRGSDGQLRKVTLARYDKLVQFDPGRPAKIDEPKPGVCYVDLTRLSHEEFEAALPRLAGASGLVFDLRGYPAGSPQWLTHLSPRPLQSARWNVPKRHQPDPADVEWDTSNWELPPAEPQLTTNRVFLIDGSAISYSETVLGIVEAYRLGELVGEATAGTNGNICDVDLPLGYRLVFTGMQVLKHDGGRHHGVGIRPTAPVAKTLQGVREGRDEQLERALSLLK